MLASLPLPDITPESLIALPLTLGAYGLARWLYRLGGQSPLLNPVLIGMAVVIAGLKLLDLPYTDYFDGAQLLHFLLGTATVALAVPLYHQLQQLRSALIPILLSVLLGSIAAASTTIIIAAVLGASETTLLSLTPKSTTTPVAMAIAADMGGLPALTAIAVIVTGILGAIGGLGLLRWLGFKNPQTCGIALGVAAHGIGTARALQVDSTLGAYSGLAMGLTALTTALLAPLLWVWLSPWLL